MKLRPLLPIILLSAAALAGCSGGDEDADDDGIVDLEDARGWEITVDLVGKRVARHVDSDPEKADSDGDGLTDPQEVTFPGGLDPRSADTDGDGLTDCQELVHTDRAQCETPGFAGPYDGGTRTSPNNADSEPGGRFFHRWASYLDETGTLQQATWGDGVPDGEERSGYDVQVMGATRHVRTDPAKADTDGDLLDDGEERLKFHTDPTVADTDGDGCIDGRDPVPDRVELHRLGLDRFEPDPSLGPAQVQFTFQDFQPHLVPADGPLQVAGEAADLRPHDPPAHGHRDGDGCPVDAYVGWLGVQVVAQKASADPAERRPLDLFSRTPGLQDHVAGGVATFYWHPREGRFSWAADGSFPVAAPLALRGPDGTLRLHPTLEFKP